MIFKNFIWIMQKINWLGSEKDEHDNYHQLTNATTNDAIVQDGSEETNALLGGREDNLNSVTNEGPTSEEYNPLPKKWACCEYLPQACSKHCCKFAANIAVSLLQT